MRPGTVVSMATEIPGLALQPGEWVILAAKPYVGGVWQFYVVTLGIYAIWRARHHFVVTNQRVIHARGIVFRSLRSVPLERIQDATMSRIVWFAMVGLSTAGGPQGVSNLGPLSMASARDFQTTILSLARGGGAGVGGIRSSGVADELGKLAALRDSGILSPEEFDAQKAKLLG